MLGRQIDGRVKKWRRGGGRGWLEMVMERKKVELMDIVERKVKKKK